MPQSSTPTPQMTARAPTRLPMAASPFIVLCLLLLSAELGSPATVLSADDHTVEDPRFLRGRTSGSSSHHNSSQRGRNNSPAAKGDGFSTSTSFTFTDGRIPLDHLAVSGPVKIEEGVLRLASYSSAEASHVYAPITKMLGVPAGRQPTHLSISLKLRVRCGNPSNHCMGNVSVMLYSPGDGGNANPDRNELTHTGLTAHLSLPNEYDQVMLNAGRLTQAQARTTGRLGLWYPMALQWGEKGLSYLSGATICKDSCANVPTLHLPPTTDWVFRISAYPVKGYEMQVDVERIDVEAQQTRIMTTPSPTPVVHTPAPTPSPTVSPTPQPTIGPIQATSMRVRVIANRGGLNDVQWSEWWFMKADGSFIEPKYSSATGSWPIDGSVDPAFAHDNDLTTTYYNADAFTSSWTVKFTKAELVAGYAWSTASTWAAKDPVSWVIDFSPDGIKWETGYDMRVYQDVPQGRSTWAGTFWLHSSCYVNNPPMPPPAIEARCLRLKILQTRRYPDVQFSEWWFLDQAGMPITTASVTATGSWPDSDGVDPACIGDNDMATKYYNEDALSSELTVEFEDLESVSGMTWSTADNQPQSDPVQWSVSYSRDCVKWVDDYYVTARPQPITTSRYAWAGTWWFPSKCVSIPGCRDSGTTAVAMPAPTEVQALCMRVRVMGNKGNAPDVQWAEWWFTAPDGSLLKPKSVSATGAWPTDGGTQPSFGADQDFGTKYYNLYVLGSAWTVRFPTIVTVGGYKYGTADDHPEKDPVSWAIDYSSDCNEWVSGFDVRTKQHITDTRYTWAGSWSFSSSCYLNRTLPGCCGCA